MLLGCRWVLDTLGAPIYDTLIDRSGLHIGAPLCFIVGIMAMLLLAMNNNLATLSASIIIFFVCGTTLTTVISAEASHRGSRVFARYATAADLGALFGPVIGWSVYEFLNVPDLAFILGALLYTIGLLAALIAFRRPSTLGAHKE